MSHETELIAANARIAELLGDAKMLNQSNHNALGKVDALTAALRVCEEALGRIEDETKHYEQSHLRRVWKLARAARAAAKALNP